MTETTLTDPVAPATTEPAETEKAPRRPRALQSRRASGRLEYYAEWMQRLQDDLTLRNQIAAFGYDNTKLAQGATLYTNAESAYLARQQALTAFVTARSAANQAFADALRAFRNLRVVALAVIDDPAIKTAFAAERRIPDDRREFVSVARAVYNTILGEPRFVQALETYGYTPEKIQNDAALLDALSLALVTRAAAQQAAVKALHDRDDTLAAMGDWIHRLTRIAAVAGRS